MLTDRERAAIASQVEELYRLVDELAVTARRRLDRVKDVISESRS